MKSPNTVWTPVGLRRSGLSRRILPSALELYSRASGTTSGRRFRQWSSPWRKLAPGSNC